MAKKKSASRAPAKPKPKSTTGLQEIWGIVMLVFFVLLTLSLISYEPKDISLLSAPPNDPPFNWIGPVGAWSSYLLLQAVGIGAYIVPVICLGLGLTLLIRKELRVWPKLVWAGVVLLSFSGLMQLSGDRWHDLASRINIDPGAVGGNISLVLVESVVERLFGPMGAGVICWALFLSGTVMFLGTDVLKAWWASIRSMSADMAESSRQRMIEHRARQEQMAYERRALQEQDARIQKALGNVEAPPDTRAKRKPKAKKEAAPEEPKKRAMLETLPVEEPAPEPEPVPEPEPEPVPEPEPPAPEPEPAPPKKERKRKPAPAKEPEPEPTDPPEDLLPLPASAEEPDPGAYVLPPMSVLNEIPVAMDSGPKVNLEAMARVLEDALSEFGVEAKVTNVERGPVVTQFEVLPAAGVRVERIKSLSNNIALALKATSVRVQAPIPGKGVVGIEIPNGKSKIVYLRGIMESSEWESHGCAVPLILGQDVGGKNRVVDLAKMPHLLIAGATGAGKTVCMNSILAGMLMSRTPEQLRLMLVDPKIVEFSGYADLPHLVVPVITDPKKVAIGLRWAIKEMERRYKMFAKVGVRNIDSFNSRPKTEQQDLFGEAGGDEEDKIPDTVPYIVIIVDELADLMLVAQAEIENSIARLAQLSRAVGIHMILATQRPSVNVITGTIKANFPARIAFQVAQKVDSRTILDAIGAEQLLGRGDMLFMPPGGTELVRAQGAMCEDDEIVRIVDFIKDQRKPRYEMAVQKKIESNIPSSDGGQDDELMEQAIEIIRETQRASTSSLQRRMRIGYTRAARLMDVLEERGIVGPPNGSDPREILIDLDAAVPDNAAQNAGDQG